MTDHPFADLIGLNVLDASENQSVCSLLVKDDLMNPHNVVHGGVLYSLADTGMGIAIYSSLKDDEICATVEIKISYFRPAINGEIICKTVIVNRGKTLASLESEILIDDKLVAKANGTYAIYSRPQSRNKVSDDL